MAFPQTGILDNFNRANEGPPASGWTGNISVVSNQGNILPFAIATYNTSFAQDQEYYFTVFTRQANGNTLTYFSRYQNANNNISIRVNRNDATNDTIYIDETVSGITTTLAGPFTIIYADGDSLGIKCIGTDVEAYHESGGTWVLVGSATTTLEVAGVFGINALSLTIDDFGGGESICVAVTSTTITPDINNSNITNEDQEFVASYLPANSDFPITYTWSVANLVSGQGTNTATYNWSTCGNYTISVSIANCETVVQDSQSVSIMAFFAIGATGYEDTRPFTFLSLPRYAQILGLNPIQFFGANSTVVSNRHCDDTWFEYVYQDSGKAARYEILLAIAQAEEELIKQVGYFPAPYWIADEKQDYPQFYQKEYATRYGYKPTGLHKSVTTDLKYVICGGIRATTQITDFVYCNDVDTDGDGFYDTAVFRVNGVDFDPCQLKAYIKQYAPSDEENCRTDMSSVDADPAWELRDIQVRYDETNEVALVYIKKWLMFKPQLQQAINATVIDADDSDSYVDTVEFWRVYNDTETQVQFLWANERSCASTACAWATQTGCFRVQNSRQGIIVPQPGTYANGSYSVTGFSQGIEPNKVRLWYYAGYQDANARGCDKLNQQWARIIAMLATARIAKPICSCENLVRKVSLWQEDVSLTNDVRSFNINPMDLSNPFGTKLGEILAWNALKNFGMKVGKRIITY